MKSTMILVACATIAMLIGCGDDFGTETGGAGDNDVDLSCEAFCEHWLVTCNLSSGSDYNLCVDNCELYRPAWASDLECFKVYHNEYECGDMYECCIAND